MDWSTLWAERMTRMRASEIRELLKLLDQPDIISFAGGIPDPALFPAEAFRAAMTSALSDQNAGVALQYSVSEGYGPLRDWIAEQMTADGIPCTRENILITSGSQQALDYLGKLMLTPGDTALVGWPTYLGAIGAFNAYQPRYAPLIPGDNRAAAEIRAEAQAAGGQVKFAYLSPDFANPTGVSMDRAERLRILDLADELGMAILEDAPYAALRYQGEAVPPILALEIARKGSIDQCRTVYCGSFSKTLAPGLRIGWACAAHEVIGRLVLLKQAADLHTATLNQIATHLVASEHFAAHVPMLRGVYGRRRDLMLAALAREMPEGVHWTRPEGGMFIWLTLPEHLDSAELLARSLRAEKIAFVPGHAFFPDGSGRNTLRLCFTLHDEAMVNEGIARLGRLLGSA
ncbi:aminotransferase-like domain-containing protein [Paracoccus zhejiangensis]|uniref:GntR family transcriptional regulator n=1 Tax=Paracoccus zhejiangensis TaxID=1077935 RepID=A0A2H5EV08_9RHOB|nr:PLP-dependent aminotransferase family protein [Paracoccus zhejiangensis]AUH63121.1 GntR family transcriptional regulator [Paracoccus zhejiangensis]